MDDTRPLTPKGRDTRRRLMAEAKRLFGERGYSRVRITDITEAAGISGGAFYRYFTGRHELMIELLRELTDEAFDFVRVPWDGDDPRASVLRSTQLYLRFYDANRELFGLLVELAQTDDEVRRIWAGSRQAFYGRIAHALRRGIESGVVRTGIDIEVAAEMLGSMSEFYAFQRFVLCDGVIKDVPIEVAGETLVDTWISGVSKRA